MKRIINSTHLPTNAEWDALVTAVGESNELLHWDNMFFWCQDIDPDWPLRRAVRGSYSARNSYSFNAAYQPVDVGFRPAFEDLSIDTLVPDGTLVTVATLYMNGDPIRVPTRPTWDGDIPGYIPGAKLEFREPLEDTTYQVKAIKVGSVLIADRCLLRRISWDVIHAQEKGAWSIT